MSDKSITVTIDREDARVFAGGMDYILDVVEGKAPLRDGCITRIRKAVADALAAETTGTQVAPLDREQAQ